MSAFGITLDAVLAVMVAGLVVTASMQLLSSREYPRDDYLLRYSYDFLAVAEKTGALGAAVGGTYTGVERLMGMLQPSACGSLAIYRGNESIYSTEKPCGESNSVVSATRVVVSGGQAHPAVLRLWYGRQEAEEE